MLKYKNFIKPVNMWLKNITLEKGLTIILIGLTTYTAGAFVLRNTQKPEINDTKGANNESVIENILCSFPEECSSENKYTTTDECMNLTCCNLPDGTNKVITNKDCIEITKQYKETLEDELTNTYQKWNEDVKKLSNENEDLAKDLYDTYKKEVNKVVDKCNSYLKEYSEEIDKISSKSTELEKSYDNNQQEYLQKLEEMRLANLRNCINTAKNTYKQPMIGSSSGTGNGYIIGPSKELEYKLNQALANCNATYGTSYLK